MEKITDKIAAAETADDGYAIIEISEARAEQRKAKAFVMRCLGVSVSLVPFYLLTLIHWAALAKVPAPFNREVTAAVLGVFAAVAGYIFKRYYGDDCKTCSDRDS